MTLPLRRELRDVEPYGAPQLRVPICLNVNENPYPPSEELVAAITDAVRSTVQGLNRYPDRDFTQLRRALSRYLQRESGVDVSPECIWAGNGSNEVMLHLLQAYGGHGRTFMSFAPTYSMYHEYARDTGTEWVAGERNADFTLNLQHVEDMLHTHHPSILVLTSPNNPTGTALSIEEVERVAELTARERVATVLVIDEAYAEFRRDGTPSALQLLDTYDHLVVTRTMSKAFGAAGLRLGYMACSQHIVADMMKVRLPYHLSAITQAAALAALDHDNALAQQVAHIRDMRDELVQWLKDEGFEVAPTDANFVMFGRFENRTRIFDGLVARGILIRVVGPEGWLRVSVGTDEENSAFKAALKEVLADG